ncbi:MFS transporter [Actinosynnema sp. NPDC020468]|uniref:MFS transporter n=1 Tax=Actinosynnema sp. NPDC020468 TaxID=3154488 RepID=UPI0033F2DC51
MAMFRALRHPSFRLLWGSVFLGQLGYWFANIAFQWEVAHRTDNDPVALGVLYFVGFTPYLAFSLFAGVLADGRDRRLLLVGIQAASVAVALACFGLTLADATPPAVVLVLAFLAGCVITFLSPAHQSLIANVVPARDLGSAVPLQAAGLNLARIAGPALAGPAILLAGSTAAFAIFTATCVGSALLAWRIKVPARARVVATESVGRRLVGGLRHARERPPTAMALLVVAIASMFGSTFQAQLPLLGARVSADGGTAFLTLVVLGGLGSLVGVLLVARRRAPLPLPATAVLLAVLGAIVSVLGYVRSFPLMAVLMAVAGGVLFGVMTSINTLIQHVVDDDQRGRVLSLYFICWGGLLPVAGLAAGALIALAGIGTAFAVLGGVTAAFGVGIAAKALTRRPTAA